MDTIQNIYIFHNINNINLFNYTINFWINNLKYAISKNLKKKSALKKKKSKTSKYQTQAPKQKKNIAQIYSNYFPNKYANA